MERFIYNFIMSGLQTYLDRPSHSNEYVIEDTGVFIVTPDKIDTECLLTEDNFCGGGGTLCYPAASVRASHRRLIKGIFGDCMDKTFTEITTTAGDKYYGSAGILLDCDKNPLLLITAVPGENYTLKKVICHVSPKIFEHVDRIVEKSIIKKVLPQCSGYILPEQICRCGREYVIISRELEVVISDCSKFIKKPIAPLSMDYNWEANKIALEHLDYIVQ